MLIDDSSSGFDPLAPEMQNEIERNRSCMDSSDSGRNNTESDGIPPTNIQIDKFTTDIATDFDLTPLFHAIDKEINGRSDADSIDSRASRKQKLGQKLSNLLIDKETIKELQLWYIDDCHI